MDFLNHRTVVTAQHRAAPIGMRLKIHHRLLERGIRFGGVLAGMRHPERMPHLMAEHLCKRGKRLHGSGRVLKYHIPAERLMKLQTAHPATRPPRLSEE